MIQEAYCFFEVSKILKKKGFDEECIGAYSETNHMITKFEPNVKNSEVGPLMYSAPTHQMAMQWLRDEHDIFITVLPDKIHNTIALFWNVYIVTEKEYKWIFAGGGVNMTYEELIEEALLYVLKTLIN